MSNTDDGMTFSPRLPRRIARLDLRAPLLTGLAVIVAFFGVGVALAGFARIDKGVGLSGTIIVESKVKPVQHQRGGTIAQIHVREGEEVKAGALLMNLDTQDLDQQISALNAQAEAAARQLDLARQEAATIKELADRKLAARSRVLGLERQVAEIEKESVALSAKISLAEQELSRAAIRAPVSGRVLSLAVRNPGAVIQGGQTIAEIVPVEDRLVIEGRLAPNQIENVKPGMPAKVWLTALSWREQRPLAARLAWVSADSVEDRRSGTPHFLARVELDDHPSELARRLKLHPGMRAEMVLLTGERTLLDELIDPLMRNVSKAFRG